MTQNEAETTTEDIEKPEIAKIQYNIEGAHMDSQAFDGIETQYAGNINHDEEAARIILQNGAWIEYRKDDDEVREVIFLPEDHDSIFTDEVVAFGIENQADFEETIAESVRTFRDMSLEEIGRSWSNVYQAI